MTDMRNVPLDDDFDAFLQRKGELSQLLQSLPQPEPSAELDAAILARAEAELANDGVAPRLAANDSAMSSAVVQPRPSFLRRRAAPLALAASVLCALLLMLRWQTQPESAMPIVVAQAPQLPASVPAPAEQTEETSAAPPAASLPAPHEGADIRKSDAAGGTTPAAKPSSPRNTASDTPQPESQVAAAPATAREAAEPPPRIAQADIANELPSRAAVPAPAAAAPSSASSNAAGDEFAAMPPNQQKAKAWIALIEELLKADLRQDALAEWEKFRQAYPRYPVPEKLEERIKSLKK